MFVVRSDHFGHRSSRYHQSLSPVAVVSLLKELGVSKRISTLIEGESLLNDGTALVLFLVLIKFVTGEDMTAGEVIA